MVGYRLDAVGKVKDGEFLRNVEGKKFSRKDALILNREQINIYNNSKGIESGHLFKLDREVGDELEFGVKTLGQIFVNSAGNERKTNGNANHFGYNTSRYTIVVAASSDDGAFCVLFKSGSQCLGKCTLQWYSCN